MNEYTKNPGEQDAAQAVSETPETAQCGCGAEVCPGCGGQDAPACPGCGACAQPDEDIAQEAVALAADAPAEDTVETITVVDVRFRNNAKSYFFDPGELSGVVGDGLDLHAHVHQLDIARPRACRAVERALGIER